MFSYQDYLEERHYNVLKESISIRFCRVWHFGGEAHISSDQFCQVRHFGYGDIRSVLPGTTLQVGRYQISSARYGTPGMEITDQFCQVRHSRYGDIRSVLPGTTLRVRIYQISSARYGTPGMETSDQFCQVRHSGYGDTSASALSRMTIREWNRV